MPRLLLSSVCRPFGMEHGDGFGTSYEGSHQLLWAEGIFRPRGTTTQWGIDFIAENVEAPTVCLHYPTLDEFIEEVKKGYDYVGIAFVAPTLHKLLPMTEAVRRYAPQSKLILGGYGTALDDADLPPADHICRGEGVAFMREILGEPVDAPMRQPFVTMDQSLFSLPYGRTGYVFAGLGCPNGCDFCATSSYFKRRHIKLLPEGKDILDAIRRLRERDRGITTYFISDEDFLLNERRGRSFLEVIRASDLPPLSLAVFSSVKALSKYQASELVEMGIDWIWIGYEGERAGYSKMEGRPYDELFTDLHNHGICVLASMIIGFDYHTPAIIEREFEELMRLRPSLTQFLIYGPAHGTPLWERLHKEGRLDPKSFSDSSRQDGFSLGFRHPVIGADEMVAIQRRLYRATYERLGPSIYRIADDWLAGYLHLRDHSMPRVREKAEVYRQKAHRSQMFLDASRRYVSPRVGDWIHDLDRRIVAATGAPRLHERAVARIVAPLALGWTDLKLRLGLDRQPTPRRRSWRMGYDPTAWQ